jgi:regulator of sigma E protease
MNFMGLLFTLAAFAVALGILIVVHEYGHYLVARMCGVKVLRFSVGFGKPLLTRRFSPDGTEWVLAALPFGGYVKMLDEREGPVKPAEVDRAFNRQSVWKRMLIVVAGPVANFILAVVLYWGLFIAGVPDARPVIAAPAAGSYAAQAGLQRGDTLLRINDEAVEGWQEARWRLLQLAIAHATVRLEVMDGGGHISWKTLDLSGFELEGLEGDPVSRIGVRLYRPDAVIGRTLPDGVAERAGLRAGDRILAVDGSPVATWDEFVIAVRDHAGKPLQVTVGRATSDSSDSRAVLVLTPEPVSDRGRTIGRIGAEPRIDAEKMKNLFIIARHDPGTAFALATAKTWDTAVFSLKMIGKMLVGEVSWRNLSGPVTIADYAGQSAQAGWVSYLVFLAIISISLGVLNLLPIPLLDGGHLLYYVAEVVKGRPVSEKAMELGQRLGLAVLLFLMVFAFYNDINRLLAG